MRIRATLIGIAVISLHCGGDDGGSGPSGLPQCADTELWNYFEVLPAGAQCDPDFRPEEEPCNTCESDAVCEDGLVSGDSGNYVGGICTLACSRDEDCGGLSYGDANDMSFESEEWSCRGGRCAVELVAPEPDPADECSRCLSACRGLSGCCTGSGCLCEDEC